MEVKSPMVEESNRVETDIRMFDKVLNELKERIGERPLPEKLQDRLKNNTNRSAPSAVESFNAMATLSNTTSSITISSEREDSAKDKRTANNISSEKDTLLAPFYVPTPRHCATGFQSVALEKYIHPETLPPHNAEVFENFRSSSIMRLRTRAEEHLKQLRVS